MHGRRALLPRVRVGVPKTVLRNGKIRDGDVVCSRASASLNVFMFAPYRAPYCIPTTFASKQHCTQVRALAYFFSLYHTRSSRDAPQLRKWTDDTE